MKEKINILAIPKPFPWGRVGMGLYSDQVNSTNYITNKYSAMHQRIEYLPFGEVMFEERKNMHGVDYLFSAKELDAESGFNYFGARYQHPKMAIFMSVDPLADKYPHLSPYNYCALNPIIYVDPDGRDIKIYYKNDKGKLNAWTFNGQNGKNAPKNEFVQSFLEAYNYNIQNGGGDNLKIAATSTEFTFNMIQTDGASVRKDIDAGNTNLTSFVCWNPNQGIETTDGQAMSPATVLEHEMAHDVRYTTTSDFRGYLNDRKPGSDKQYENKEEKRVITGPEAKTARANKEVPKNYTRPNHSGKRIITPSPTSNKKLRYKE